MTALIHRPALPPMPATDCPSWCESDHYAEWRRHAESLSADVTIPMSDGSTATLPAQSPEQLVATFTALHVQPLYGAGSVVVDLMQDPHGHPAIYLEAGGDLTAEGARTLASVLLEAATSLEEAGTVSPSV